MVDFDVEIKKDFLEEALVNLNEVNGFFMKIDTISDTKFLIDKMFFLAHNLKGGSMSVGLNEITEFTNQLELLVIKIQNNKIPISGEVIKTLKRSNVRLVEMLLVLKENLAATFDNSDILIDLQSWLKGA